VKGGAVGHGGGTLLCGPPTIGLGGGWCGEWMDPALINKLCWWTDCVPCSIEERGGGGQGVVCEGGVLEHASEVKMEELSMY